MVILVIDTQFIFKDFERVFFSILEIVILQLCLNNSAAMAMRYEYKNRAANIIILFL